MAKITKKDKRRALIWIMVIVIIVSYLTVFSFHYWNQILSNKKQKQKLETEYQVLLEKEDDLKNQINKLQDPEYISEYAREKFMLSKEGEIRIVVPEEVEN